MVQEMIQHNGDNCLGIEDVNNGQLQAWVLQYLEGSLGMIHCQPDFRRRGYTKQLLRTIMKANNASLLLFAYIVNGNEPSESLFQKSLQWKRISTTEWVTFIKK